jgi:CRISPR type IV-associated protein Csf3
MEALKVTFTFTSPVVRESEYPIHLDALAAWCIVDEAESFGADNAWAAGDDLSHIFGKAEAPDGQWVWQASCLHFTPASERALINMIRKCDPLRYMAGYDRGVIDGRSRKHITSGSGQERAYQFFAPYQWFARAEAWCLADRDALEDLLGRLRSIGKMGRNGFGLIKDVVIESDDMANEQWKVRTLPLSMSGAPNATYTPTLQCLHAPYWKKTNRVLANEPLLV